MHKQKYAAEVRENFYNSSPNLCAECGLSIPYKNRRNKFCSKSCSAKYNNKKRANAGWVPSEEQKEKTRKALIGKQREKITRYKNVNCVCGNVFNVLKSSNAKYCSPSCRKTNMGGERKGSGRAKTGYYKGIYCGSTYELVWVIYRIDNNLPVCRFDGFIEYEGGKYYPDFIDGNTIHEMKGWTNKHIDEVLRRKEKAAIDNGYNIHLYFKKDLTKEFEWVKNNYSFSNLCDLYDNAKYKHAIVCENCGVVFHTDNKKRKRCSKKCCGTPKGHKFISHSSSG